MLLHIYQIFGTLLIFLHFFVHFYFTFIEKFFNVHPVSTIGADKIVILGDVKTMLCDTLPSPPSSSSHLLSPARTTPTRRRLSSPSEAALASAPSRPLTMSSLLVPSSVLPPSTTAPCPAAFYMTALSAS